MNESILPDDYVQIHWIEQEDYCQKQIECEENHIPKEESRAVKEGKKLHSGLFRAWTKEDKAMPSAHATYSPPDQIL